jgi:Carbohydrate-selective porin, OprB family
VSEHQIHGSGLSSNYLDNLLVVSGVEALGSTRLFNLWIEQKFGNQANLRVGQFSAGQEFMVSDYANLFVNASFGWPGLASQDLPSGGSTYPEATPGVRLAIAPDDPLSLLMGVFDGNPAGRGLNNPITRDPSGVLFRTNDPAFFIAEINYDYNQDKIGGLGNDPNQEGTQGRTIDRRASGASGLPGTVKFGAWVNGGVFPDERFNTLGGLLGIVGGQPLPHRGDYAFYGVLDQILWRPGGGDRREFDFFLRASRRPERPQPDRRLFRRRPHLEGAACVAPGRHAGPRLRVRPHFSEGERRRTRRAGRDRDTDADPEFRGGDRAHLQDAARQRLVVPAGPAIRHPPRRQHPRSRHRERHGADLQCARDRRAHAAEVLIWPCCARPSR